MAVRTRRIENLGVEDVFYGRRGGFALSSGLIRYLSCRSRTQRGKPVGLEIIWLEWI